MKDTRYLIAEQAQRILNGGATTSDTEVRLEELVIFVDQAFASFIKTAYFENRNDGENYVNGTFIYSFVEDVKFDNIRKRYYANIPSAYVNLPNGIGLYSVHPVEDDTDSFIPINTMFLSLGSGLTVSTMQGRKSYFIENKKIYLANLSPDFCTKQIIMKLVGGMQSDEEFDFDISMDMQGQIAQGVVELYMAQLQTPKDEITDNVKNN